jgi:hypothetical protein
MTLPPPGSCPAGCYRDIIQRAGSAGDVQILKRIQGVRAKRSMVTSTVCFELSDSKPPLKDAQGWLING